MAWYNWNAFMWVVFCLVFGSRALPTCLAETHRFHWDISLVNYTRNCFTKPLMVVNGQYPGPTILVTEGDQVIVHVTNTGNSNVTIHWHGLRQLRSCWMDGASQITQCPIQPGDFMIYDFVVSGQRGTNFWHAHASWTRASVHGAFITKPYDHQYPFLMPHKEIPVILGEWWNQDVVLMEEQVLDTGSGFPVADLLTMNGLPGTLYNCSESEGVTTVDVEPGQTYLLRVINAALQSEMFFSIANHSLTVVEVEGNYVKPFTVDRGIVIAAGSYMNVLVTTNQAVGTYYMVGQPHSTALVTDFTVLPPVVVSEVLHYYPQIPTTGLFRYKSAGQETGRALYPDIPKVNDTTYSKNFWTSLKSLHPKNLGQSSDHVRHLLIIGGVGTQPCFACPIPHMRFSGMLNNISWVNPATALLHAYYENIPGVYWPTFPDFPPNPFNYTDGVSPPLPSQLTESATRVIELEYATEVELVIQGIDYDFFEDHPMHLHGHEFYVLGQGIGNYNATSDSANFNYYDPPARVSVNVPARGWVAIRFTANNPGTWLFHCHVERHMSWGMQTAFVVKEGKENDQKLLPPKRLNPC